MPKLQRNKACITCRHGFIKKGEWDCKLNQPEKPCSKWEENNRKKIEKKKAQKLLKTLAIIVLVSVLFPLGYVHADYFLDGNDLVEYMREYEKIERGDTSALLSLASRYAGYVTGVYDATRFQYSYPPNVTRGQVCAIVAKYLNKHPEKWNQPASDLVIEALKQAFPKGR